MWGIGLVLYFMILFTCTTHSAGFVRAVVRGRARSTPSLRQAGTNEDNSITIGQRTVTASLLRNLELTDYTGKKKTIGSVVGNNKSVVVFLRHLG